MSESTEISGALTSEAIHAALDALLDRRDPDVSGTVLGAGSDDLEGGRRFLDVLVDGGWMVPSWPIRHGLPSPPKPDRPTSSERSAFCSDSLNVRPMAIASPTDFICVFSVGSAVENFSNANRGTLTTT